MQPPPSSVPPPGYPSPPPRKGLPAWGWVLIGCIPIFLIFVIAVLAAILFPVFAKARQKAQEISCMSNERQMALGMLQYAQDSDENFPAAASWMDKTSAYVRSDQPYHCPSAWDKDPAKYGYAYNSTLGSKSLAQFADPRTTATLYDSTNLARNASDALTSLPDPPRHDGGNDIAFLDGHVRNTKEAGP